MSIILKPLLIVILVTNLSPGFVDVEMDQSDDEKSIRALTETLYEEFINRSNASPGEKLNSNQYYVLDFELHKVKLVRLGFFTDAFIQNEKERYSDCSAALEQAKIKEEEVEEDIAYIMPVECSFFSYIYYLQAQEYPSYYQLENLKIRENHASGELHYYDNEENNWDNLIYLELTFSFINNKWKVHTIEKKN